MMTRTPFVMIAGGLGACSVLTMLAVTQSTGASQAAPPETIEVTGVVRDFHERGKPGGHPDFEMEPSGGFGRYSGNVATELGADGKPVFTGNGYRVTEQWRDSAHRQICHNLFDETRGDNEGKWGISSRGGITSADSFSQWYRDVPGVNMSYPLTLTMMRQADGHYVFDDQLDPLYRERRGFFPIDGMLFGNSGGSPDHNFHFTFELRMDFEYDADGDQFFKFIGDDDVFVFIDGRLVIDLGGVHAAHDQYVDLDRLNLEDGQTYAIDFFFAERHRTQSNFRIETNIPLRTAGLPSMNAAFD